MASLLFLLVVSSAAPWAVANAQTVTLSLGPNELQESNAVATNVVVTATVSPPQATETTVTLSLGGTARRGTDYTVPATLPSITVPAGQAKQTADLRITPVDDSFWEGEELITVKGTATGNLGVVEASIRLADNDSRPWVFITAEVANGLVIQETGGPGTVRVFAQLIASQSTLEGATLVALSLSGSATRNADYTIPDAQLSITIPAGATFGYTDLVVTPISDSQREDIEELIVVRASATDHLARQLPVTQHDRPLVRLGDARGGPTTSPQGQIALTVSREFIREKEISNNQQVSLTVTATASRGLPSAISKRPTLTPEQECPVSVSQPGEISLSSGTSGASDLTTVQVTATAGFDSARFDTSCRIKVEFESVSTYIEVLPDELPFITSLQLVAWESHTRPLHILTQGEAVNFSIAFNRPISFTSAQLSFRLGDRLRTLTCEAGGAINGPPRNNIGCWFWIRGDDSAPAGFRLTKNALRFEGLSDLDPELSVDSVPIPEQFRGLVEVFSSREPALVFPAKPNFRLSLSRPSVQEGTGPIPLTITATLSTSSASLSEAVSIPLVFGGRTSIATADDFRVSGDLAITVPPNRRGASQTLTFTALADGLPEARTETLPIAGGRFGRFDVIGTDLILIDAPVIDLSAEPSTVSESGGAQTVTVTASFRESVDAMGSGPIEVTLVTSGTAGSNDYSIGEALVVNIPRNASSGTATLTLTPVNDRLLEGDETIVLTGRAAGVSVRGATTITLQDDETTPEVILTASPSTLREDDTEATQITVSAVLDPNVVLPDRDTVVPLSLGGTAARGTEGDYTAMWSPQSPQITIPQGMRDGSATVTLTVTPQQDEVAEGDETIIVEGTASTGFVVDVRKSTVTLADDEVPALVMDPDQLVVLEGGAAKYTVALAQQPAEPVTVTMTTDLSSSDLAVNRTSLYFTPQNWNRQQDVRVTAADDEDMDADPTVTLAHKASGGAYEGVAKDLTVTIAEDDRPTVVVSPTTLLVLEGSSQTYSVALGTQPAGDVTVTMTTSLAGTDLSVSPSPTRLTFDADTWDDPQTVTVRAARDADALTDPAVDLVHAVSGAAGSGYESVTAKSVRVQIMDTTKPELSVRDATAGEGAGEIGFEVTLSQPTGNPVTVGYTTKGGTAISGADFTEAIGTVRFAAEQTSKTVTVAILDDTIDEPNETFELHLRTPVNATVADGEATGTITDNDAAPTALALAVSPSSAAESADATSITVTASLVGTQRLAETTVTVSQTGGTATSGTDYKAIESFTVTIPAGASSGTATLSFDPEEDTLDEPDETVVLTGSGPDALGLTAGTATLTITDNDAPTAVTLAVSPGSATESAEATEITVTASLVGSQRSVATAVTVSRTGGTATSGTDYAALSDFTVTIPAEASSGTATISFDPTEDTLDESDETVVLTGSVPAALSLTAATATLTITDNDAPPTAVTLGMSPGSAAESAEATEITVTATLVGSQRTESTAVTVSQTGGTATSGTDYAAISDFTVTIAAGASSGTATLSFDPTEDTLDESDETVVLTGSGPSALNLTAGTATLTITDNDDAPTAVTLAVSPNSVAESAEATEITVTATLVGSQRTESTAVTVSQMGGTATSGTDYAAISTFTVTIPAEQSSGTATLSFDPTEDTIDDDNETVVLTGSGPSALNLMAGTATVTITDNDDPPTAVTLAVSPNSALESASATNITVTATLVGSQRTAETAVTVSRTGGTATSGTDYAAISNFTVTIAAGASSGTATLSFDPTEDTLAEGNETVVLTGAGPEVLRLTAGTATLTITDNDTAPTALSLAVSPASAAESASATSITVTASLVGSVQLPTATAVTVSRTGGTATSGTDYAAISNFTVTIAAGASSGTATLSFDPTEDTIDEDNETVVLTGEAPTALSLTAGTATLTITDDDDAPTAVTLAVNPNSALESASATSITVTASLVGSQRTESTAVTVSRTGGTATSGTDYAAISNFTVTIAAGASNGTATLSFDPTEDTIDDDDETVILTGSAPSGLNLAAGTATLTITDNDDPPTAVSLAVSPNSVAEGANATNITVTATLVGSQRAAETAVTVSRTGGTATSGTDYATISNFTVTIAAGASSGTATLSFDPTEDTIDEDNETVILTGSAPSGLSLTAGTATLTITDNDDAPTAVSLAVSPNSALESAAATSITVTATLVGSQRTESTAVTVSQTGGTATSGTDYAAISDFTVTIAAGASSGTATLSFDPTEDTLDEDNETVILTGSAPSGLSLTAGTATLTITDNDDAPTAVSLAVSPNSALESAAATSITVTASLVGSQRTESTAVTVSRTGGTATSGTDYAAISDFTVTIAAGQTSGTATLSFDPTEDTLDEDNETVMLTARGPPSLSLAAGTATLTITDNDDAPTAVTLAVSPNSVAEGANATNITVTATLLGSQRTESTAVTVSRTGGTATSDTDYAAISDFTVTIAAGASSGTATLSFDPTEDTLDEDNETVVLTGSAPEALNLTAGTATLTIADNDDAPTAVSLAVSPNSALESAAATSITVTASLVGSQRTADTAVTVRRTGGTATSGTDYAAISDFTVTIAAGASSGTATLSFDPTEDTLDEDNETVVLTGSGPSALSLAAGTATLTITDNDAAPTAVTLAVNPNSVAEGANATNITVTATLVGSQRIESTAVTVSRTGGTATSGTDYAAISNFTVTIAAGASSGTATLSFDPTEDTLDEENETVVLTGSGPSALSLTAGTATLTITDNDDPPTAVTLAVSPNSVAEGANATNITVTASLVGSQRIESTAVTVSRTGGTATSGTDYAAISNFTVTIAAGASSGTATLSFDSTEDTLDEEDETVVLTGSGPSALSLTAGTATLTITDNDDPPTAVTLAVSPNSVAEGANATNITVTASLVGSQRIESTAVTVSRTGGTATSGTDYAAISNFTVTIAAGASSGTATLSFDPTEDTLDEENETVVLTGSAPSALSLTAGTATLTITDNDAAPTAVTLAVSPNAVAEGADATNITVTASLVGSQRTESTAVTVSRTGGTATSGTDYAAISDFTVTIAAGASSGTATLSFDPTEDTLDEDNETVVLTGSGPSALSLTAGTTTLTITDNDAAPTAVTLAVSPNAVAEGANATNITVTATLVGSQRTAETAVTVSQTGGTATSDTDYAAISNFTVTIAAGASSGTATLSFDPTEDTLDEDNETVVLTGSGPSALSLTAGTATLTITDDDDAPTAVTLAVSPNAVAEGANATNITVTATLVGSQRTAETAVTVSQTGGTATSDTDYAAISNFTVTIAAGASSGTATLSFDPTEDTLDEDNETVVLTGSGPSALSLTAGTATLTITDDDDAPTAVTLAVSPNAVAEGANATNITVTATLVGSQRTESTAVTVSQTGGTATSDTDYAAISNFTVTIAAGASSGTATLSFDPTEDTLDEDNETVVLTGSGPSALSLTAGTATLTITDNDAAPTAVTLAVSPNAVAEGANATNITVTASLVGSQRTESTAVTVSRTGGSATSGTDYAAISNFTVTIAAGASSGTATLSFDPTEDTLDEDNETVVLTGSGPSALSLAAGTATLTITDNDAAPTAVTLAVSPNAVAEGANATNITVTASLVGSQRTAQTAVTVSRTGGTATSGTDYAAISDFTVTIAAGQTSGTATLSFDPTDDTIDDDNETVVLTGSGPSALSLAAGTATLTITDNDAAPTAVILAVSPNSVAEGASATNITVTASLNGSQRTESTAVTVTRTGGTATSGTDYAAISTFTVTIPAEASSGTATLSFDPTDDTIDDDNETVVLTGAAPSALGLTAGTATLTITDNDAAPTAVNLAVSPTSVAESANATDITVTASLVGSQRSEPTAVTVSRTGGTATSGTDYAAISNFTVTIAAGASSGTATLGFDPTEDTLDEENETVVLTGAAPNALSLTAGTATLTITDNDAAPTAVNLAVSPNSVAEGANATSITVTASLTGSQRTESTAVTVSRTGGTATSGTDYAAISDFTVTIAAGASSGTATLSFDPTDDTLDEENETVVLTGAAPNALSLAAGTATLTITDNDAAPTAVNLAVSPNSVAEGANATNITVTASLTGSQRTAETAVTVSRTGGTATSGTDYAAISDFTVTIAAGASSGTATLSFDPTDDTLDEENETVVLTGSAPTALSLAAGTATLTITDNDAAPTAVTLAVSPTSVAEGANATNITVTASLTGSQRTESTAVTVSQMGGTATSGTDYAAISNFTVTIAAGASSGTATLSFDPTEDTLAEGDETVVLTGSAPTALSLTAGTATLTITDNDAAPTAVTLAVSPTSVAEGANATNITVTASLTGSQRTESTAVTVSQMGGTATSGTDYAAISDFTVTIAAGASSGTATLSFDPTEDTLAEGDETVVLTGSAPTALSLTAGTATLTITDNDAAPTAVNLAVSPNSVAESANATNITVTASLTGSQRTESTAVTVSQMGGTATSGTDYAAISDFTVTIAAGASSGTATLSFDPTEDTLAEGDETVVLTGSAPTALSLTAGTATLTITDNDAAPTAVNLAVSPNSVAEGANATNITVTASLNGSQRTESTAVTVSRTGGTATSGTDYAAISDFTVTIAAGETSGTATLSFDPTEDTLDEENETVVLTGSAPTALSLTAGTATLTIADNDAAPTAVNLAVSPPSVAEGANATSITVTASLTGSQRTESTAVTVSRTGGTATSGTDYAAISDFTVTIAAGASSGTATLSFDPSEDTLAEGDETVVLTGSAPTALSLTAGTATLTIADNDAAPTAVNLAVSPPSVAEGANATNITVTASLTGSQRTESTAVTVSRTGGTATSGTDYAAISDFTVTIAAGASSGTATLSFDPSEDTLAEGDETVVLTGSAPTALSLTAGTATLTITDNDAAPTAVNLAVSPPSVAEGANATNITVTASLTGSQRTESTAVTVSRTGGTATSGTDYAAISDFTVTIAAGASSGTATLSFDPSEDTLAEGDETVVLTGSAPSALGLTAGTATLTITDNDAAPTAVNLAVSPTSVAEGANATSITVTASLNGSQRTESTAVTVSRTGGTATSGTDYAAISTFTVTIAAGASSGTATLSFDPTEDTLDESDETVVLTGSAPSALGLTAGTATLTITDNDAAPTAVNLAVSPTSVAEGANATSITVTASLTGSQRTESTAVTVSRTGGTATSGTDYAAISDFTVTIAAGASSGTATLSFDPTDDTLDEENETVVLTGSAPSALNLAAGTATLTITDNDAAPTAVTLAVSPSSVAEGANATSITVTASLTGSQRTAETAVTVSRTGGTATSGTDYAAISNFTVTIAAGASSGTATLSFDPTEDTLAEGDETVVLTGSAPTALSLTAGTATLTISDNDAAPTAVTLAVSPNSVAEGANATNITVTASLNGSQRTESTAVTVSRTGGTATSGTDYAAISNFTVTIAAGETSGTATLSFDPEEDTLDEDNETVVLTGSAPTALSLTAGTATLTISDNDAAPTAVTLAVSPSSAAESASATSITVTATLVGSQRTADTAVTVSRTGGTATSGTDYAAISNFTVTIAAGASSGTATLSFDPTEDTLDEDNETVVLTGSGPSGLSLTAGTATLTITDNDAAPTAVTLAVSPNSVAEGANATSITVTASLTGSQRTAETAVTVNQTGGTATSGTDYAAISDFTVTIAAGASSGTATLSFDPTEDTLAEDDETVVLTGAGPSDLSLTAGTATLTITDNDSAPTAVTLAVSPSSAAESASATSITVTASLNGSQRSESTAVTVSRTGGTATSGTDYAAISNFTVTIAAGASSGTATLSFDPTEDTLAEDDETVVLTGAGPSDLSLTAGTATLTITDNDSAPTAVTLAVSPSSAAESASATSITVTASLNGSQRSESTAVTVSRTGGTATSGTDYAAISNFTVTIAAGASSGTATLSFDPTEDTLDEANETVVLTGSAPAALSLTAGTATLTITDNDAAPTAVTLAVSPNSVAEDANATGITVTASLTGSQRTESTAVTVSRTGGTATSGTDYAAISNFTVTIAAGASSGTATLSFNPTEDTLDESDETVVLTGSAPSALNLTTGTATLTITDNDDAPTAVNLAVSPSSVAEGANATNITVTASLTGSQRTESTAVTVSRTGGTATSGTDYAAISNFTVTIAAGASSGTATLSFDPTEDTLDESDETVVLTGSAPSALSLTAGTATLTISDNDNDLRPTFSPASNTTTTNAGTDITLTFPEAIRKDNANSDFADADLSGVLTLKRTGATGRDIPYAATINSARTIITVNPAANLPEGAVHVGISNAYFDAAASQGQAASATFTVDTTGPAQPAFDPANATTVTNAGRNITLTFREAVRRTSSGAEFTTEAQLKRILVLKAGGSSGADIAYAASINSGRTVITIDPSASLSDGGVHVAVTDGYYDVHGNRGQAASATFTVDTTGVSPPVFDPPDNATVADAGTNITLTFDEAIRRTGGGGEFTTEAQLKAILALKAGGSTGADIAYAASINSGGTVITIDPSASLSDGAVHVAVTDGYYDVHGNRGQAASATFTVDTALAVTPPLIRTRPEPLQLALWTDRPAYLAGETIRLFHSLRRHDDHGQYRAFAWLEPAGGGERRYLAPLSADAALHAEAVDTRGLPEHASRARLLPRTDRALAFEGEAPAPGLWRFVLELRPGSADEQYEKPAEPMRTRRAWAGFTVAERSQVLNRRGFDREIRADLTLRSDTLHYLGHQLFVRDGATLAIEPGAVLLGRGRNAAIIVETGGRIVAEGTREAPVVLGCSAPVGQRQPGCWGGLRILGKAPVTRLEGVAPGVLPAGRAVYGGADAEDSSGVLRHVRVEFAGAAGDEPPAAGPALGLYGTGSGTVLDHVQTHASLGDGFAFHGGTSVCGHCVAGGSGGAGLSWQRGWRGGASHLYVQHGSRGLDGLAGRNDDRGHDLEPRSLPTLSNVTLVHTFAHGARERKAVALRLSTGSGVRARDLLATRFLAGAIDARGRSALLFDEGGSSVSGALLHLNGDRQLEGGIRDAVEFIARDPQLRDERWFANPDPRPKAGSPALHGDGDGYIGAFGRKQNWLEEWTVFGPESAYDTRKETADDR